MTRFQQLGRALLAGLALAAGGAWAQWAPSERINFVIGVARAAPSTSTRAASATRSNSCA
jgi:hypothetical protein